MNRLALIGILFIQLLSAQQATISEEDMTMKTYMFSDPSSIPQIGRLYPYFRFDGYTDKGEDKAWKMVVLENEHIKVYVCPDIGGKIWGAIEKSTGKEFLYFNHSVKFRDVAMRGAWTSGGLEYNFGDIGHIPTCATPVDYKIKTNDDGSVSCVVGALDLPSRTNWNVEITLPKDKAYFHTKATWVNNTTLPVTYYHWMNAAAKADGNLEFLYPGNKRIGHGGELDDWPLDDGKEIRFYEKNNFGIYKSYHVINGYADYFGGYYHDDNFGFGHHSTYDDKPGKKIWIWGLSDQGMIWEDLLTDSDGQYIEYQAGKLFNQAANSSTFTPFKHREFSPYDTDEMNEYWFPLKETGGMVAASEYAVLNVERNNNEVRLYLSPLQDLNEVIWVKSQGKEIKEFKVKLKALELFSMKFDLAAESEFEVILGNNKLRYNSDLKKQIVERPHDPNPDFDWNTAYGKYVEALEFEKQRRYTEAMESYLNSYQLEPGFSPTLNRLAMAYYRLGDYNEALKYAEQSLTIDTYDALGNYAFGLIHSAKDNWSLAKSGFSISSQSISYRSASYTELAKLYLNEGILNKAEIYADKALVFNGKNVQALEILALIKRMNNEKSSALALLDKIENIDAINHFTSTERMFNGIVDTPKLKDQITNELPSESYLELALKYHNYGRKKEAIDILKQAPEKPMVLLWLAYLNSDDQIETLKKAITLPADMVFPHRMESLKMLEYFIEKDSNWKLKYYLSLIYWNKGMQDKAKSLFEACGNEPDMVAFYLTKAKLFKGEQEIVSNSLKKAAEIDDSDWRVNLAVIEWQYNNKKYNSARKIAKKYLKLYPENARIGMFYAKSLMGLELYNKCIAFLSNYKVLPYEGATEGRALFHEACVKASMKALKEKKYKKAAEYIQKAKLWPKNLGVGKHYDVDERLENYIQAYSLEKLGISDDAHKVYKDLVAHRTPEYLNENSKLLLQLLAMRSNNEENKAVEMLRNAREKNPGNIYLKWVETKFNGKDTEQIEKEILESDVVVLDYDTKFVDREYEIVKELVIVLGL